MSRGTDFGHGRNRKIPTGKFIAGLTDPAPDVTPVDRARNPLKHLAERLLLDCTQAVLKIGESRKVNLGPDASASFKWFNDGPAAFPFAVCCELTNRDPVVTRLRLADRACLRTEGPKRYLIPPKQKQALRA